MENSKIKIDNVNVYFKGVVAYCNRNEFIKAKNNKSEECFCNWCDDYGIIPIG